MAFQKIIIVLELIDVFNHHCVENFYSADREWAREEEISIGRATLKIESIPTREILVPKPLLLWLHLVSSFCLQLKQPQDKGKSQPP